jgi:hypothetical protein
VQSCCSRHRWTSRSASRRTSAQWPRCLARVLQGILSLVTRPRLKVVGVWQKAPCYGCCGVSPRWGKPSAPRSLQGRSPSELRKALLEARDARLSVRIAFGARHQHAYAPHRQLLLRPRHHRPRRRTREPRNELSPSHPGILSLYAGAYRGEGCKETVVRPNFPCYRGPSCCRARCIALVRKWPISSQVQAAPCPQLAKADKRPLNR